MELVWNISKVEPMHIYQCSYRHDSYLSSSHSGRYHHRWIQSSLRVLKKRLWKLIELNSFQFWISSNAFYPSFTQVRYLSELSLKGQKSSKHCPLNRFRRWMKHRAREQLRENEISHVELADWTLSNFRHINQESYIRTKCSNLR